MSLTPTLFTSAFADGADTTKFRPSDLNNITGLLTRLLDGAAVTGALLYRDTASNDGATWLAAAQGVLMGSGAGVAPAYTMSPSLTSVAATAAANAGGFSTKVTADTFDRIAIKSDRILFGIGSAAADMTLQSLNADDIHALVLSRTVANAMPAIRIVNLDPTAASPRQVAGYYLVNYDTGSVEIKGSMHQYGSNYSVAAFQRFTNFSNEQGAGVIIRAVENTGIIKFIVGGSGLTERMRIDASGNVGIGITSPEFPLDVGGLGLQIRTTSDQGLNLNTSVGDARSATIRFRKSRGTYASPTDAVDGDSIGEILSLPRSTSFKELLSIQIAVDGTFTTNQNPPTRIGFYTNAANGAATERLRIKSDGDIQLFKALVALGGGSAPTLGTIGGSGPATAGQNAWLRWIDSTGAACWVPVWK